MLLSPHESQVVELMGKGLSRAEISDRLRVSRKCVSVFIEREQNFAQKRRFNSDISPFEWRFADKCDRPYWRSQSREHKSIRVRLSRNPR